MLKEERQQLLLKELYTKGKVEVNDLSLKYNMSKDTLRRDLNELEGQGVLKRVYGGAVYQKIPALTIDDRYFMQKNEKYLVAQKAAKLIKTDSLIAIDGGTTNVMLAKLIPVAKKLRVVTNSFPVATELHNKPNIDVVFLGGRVDNGSRTTVGEIVVKQLRTFRFDQCFLGVYALDAKLGLTVPFPYDKEAELKKEIIFNSDEVYAMATIEKLDKNDRYVVCNIDDITKIVCEHSVSKELNQKYKNKII